MSKCEEICNLPADDVDRGEAAGDNTRGDEGSGEGDRGDWHIGVVSIDIGFDEGKQLERLFCFSCCSPDRLLSSHF